MKKIFRNQSGIGKLDIILIGTVAIIVLTMVLVISGCTTDNSKNILMAIGWGSAGICILIPIVLLIVSKEMDIAIGALGIIGGIALYGWWNSDDALEARLDLALESNLEVLPDDVQTGIIILIVASIILFVIGLVRGKKVQQQIVVVQQAPSGQTPEQIVKQIENGEINKAGTMVCPKCNQEIKAGVKFCTKCGANIEETKKDIARKMNKKTLCWIVIIVILLFIFGIWMGCESSKRFNKEFNFIKPINESQENVVNDTNSNNESNSKKNKKNGIDLEQFKK